ncbi:MAG: uracil-DNA glycosylase [Candidatus Omnitrophica bacterium]|nr:uracil-DNA glycosylase [Candidatus Omnitrophota bacterium]
MTLSKTPSKFEQALKKSEQYLKYLESSGIKHVPLAPSLSLSPEGGERKSHGGKQAALEALNKIVRPCTLCPELANTRKSVVFGSGDSEAELLFVGEAPGFEEDLQGLPFVGKAGQLLTKIIESIGFKRGEVYIANVLKCRPPANRNPLPEEVINCQPYLKQQIAIIQPKIICVLGNFAAQTLLGTGTSITRLRGNWGSYEGIPVMPTFHPAYLLRNPADKRKTWEDMKMIRERLQRVRITKST